jgi:hypothetical protein
MEDQRCLPGRKGSETFNILQYRIGNLKQSKHSKKLRKGVQRILLLSHIKEHSLESSLTVSKRDLSSWDTNPKIKCFNYHRPVKVKNNRRIIQHSRIESSISTVSVLLVRVKSI